MYPSRSNGSYSQGQPARSKKQAHVASSRERNVMPRYVVGIPGWIATFISIPGRKPRPSGRGGSPSALLLDVALDGLQRGSAARHCAIGRGPEVRAPELAAHLRQIGSAHAPGAYSLEGVDEPGERDLGRVPHKQMHMIALPSCLSELALEVPADLFPRRVKHRENTLRDDCAPVLWHEDQMDLKRENYVTTAAKVAGTGHRPSYDPCRDPAQGIPLPRLPDAHARDALARVGKRPALAVESRQRAAAHGLGAPARRAALSDRL